MHTRKKGKQQVYFGVQNTFFLPLLAKLAQTRNREQNVSNTGAILDVYATTSFISNNFYELTKETRTTKVNKQEEHRKEQ